MKPFRLFLNVNKPQYIYIYVSWYNIIYIFILDTSVEKFIWQENIEMINNKHWLQPTIKVPIKTNYFFIFKNQLTNNIIIFF